MKEMHDYQKDLAEIRSMMERSSRFLSLSGLSGILAGIYALSGAAIAFFILNFEPEGIFGMSATLPGPGIRGLVWLAAAVLIASLGTAVGLSVRKAGKKSERIWNAGSRRLLVTIAVPLISGGVFMLICIALGLTGLLIPLSLIFYGLALFNAGQITYNEIRVLGLLQIGLGLLSALMIPYSLLFWALGFGGLHILYGSWIYLKHER